MENIQYYLQLFHDEIQNDILNAPTDENTIEYLSTCLEETYETILETVQAESK